MTARTKIALGLIASVGLVWLVVWPVYLALPDTIPAHLNFAGEIDRWGSKVEVLVMPLVYTVGALFAALIVWAAPLEVTREHAPIALAVGGAFVLIALLHPVSVYLAAGDPASIDRYTNVFLGLVLAVLGIGVAASRLEPNHWFGLRTPATMKSRETWRRGNRLAGVGIALLGALVVVLTLLGAATTWTLALMLGGLVFIAAVVSVIAARG